MKGITVLATGVCVLAFVAGACGIDRSAKMSDSVAIETSSFNGGYSAGLSLWGETATAALSGRWAIVAGLAGGQRWFDGDADPRYLDASLGVKCYPFLLTGISLYGTYGITEMGRGPDESLVTLDVKQRFIAADEPVSPFVRATAGARASGRVADNVYFPYEEFFASLLAGVDFAMRDDFAIVFEGGCFGTEGSAAAPGPWRGWLGAVYMKYYWY